MRVVKRSLAMAVTTVAVAGITFAGVAPASAAPAGAAAASGSTCNSILQQVRAHLIKANDYEMLAKKEAAKAHPDKGKITQYKAKVVNETEIAQAYQKRYAQMCGK